MAETKLDKFIVERLKEMRAEMRGGKFYTTDVLAHVKNNGQLQNLINACGYQHRERNKHLKRDLLTRINQSLTKIADKEGPRPIEIEKLPDEKEGRPVPFRFLGEIPEGDQIKELCHGADFILKGCGSLYIFGGVLVLCGGFGLSIPTNSQMFVGISKNGSGNVTFKEIGGVTVADETRASISALVAGRTKEMKQYDEKTKNKIMPYFDALGNYDYTFIFSFPASQRFGTSGTIAAILAAIASYHYTNKLQKGEENVPVFPDIKELNGESFQPIFSFNLPEKSMSLEKVVSIKKTQPYSKKQVELFKDYVKVCQVFEHLIHTSHEVGVDIKKGEEVGIKTYSSGGAPLTTVFGRPIKVSITEGGDVDFTKTQVSPSFPSNTPYFAILKTKRRNVPTYQALGRFVENFCRIVPAPVEKTEERAWREGILRGLRDLSDGIVNGAYALLSNYQPFEESQTDVRQLLIQLQRIQQGIYHQLALSSGTVDTFSNAMEKEKIGISSIGSGLGETLFVTYATKDKRKVLEEEIGIGETFNLTEKISFTSPPLSGLRLEKRKKDDIQ